MKPMRNKNRKRYFITGAGNCGTSLVAGALSRVVALVQNSRRFHEHSDVVDINDDLIAGKDRTEDMSTFLSAEHELAFKDPRFRETLGQWLELVDGEDDVYLICCFRTPKYNAASLKISEEELRKQNKKVINQIKAFCNVDD